MVFVDDKEIKLNEDGTTPDKYDIGTKLKIKATAEGHDDLEKEFEVKDELTDGKNSLELKLTKKKVTKTFPILHAINEECA